jgi:hypothetical protein
MERYITHKSRLGPRAVELRPADSWGRLSPHLDLSRYLQRELFLARRS